MLSIQTLGKATESKVNYYTELASSSYYTEAQEPEGCFYGELARKLKLSNKSVSNDILSALSRGYSPKGKALVKNAGDEHRMGFDLTFSAPKSVSVCFGLADETLRTQIQEAHDKAVKRALNYIECQLIQTRHGFEDDGRRHFTKTENALFALFEHGSSRSNDPALHTHAILLNFTQLADSSFRCLEVPELFRHKKVLGALYRCELAQQMAQLGLTVEKDESFFKVSKVPARLVQIFSKRSNQISELLEKSGFSKASAKLKQTAALFTRSKKQTVSREQLYQNWREEAQSELGKSWTPESTLRKESVSERLDVKEFLDELTEKNAIFQEKDVLESLLIKYQHMGRGADAAFHMFNQLLRSKDYIKQINHPTEGICYTTQRQYLLEKRFYENALAYSDTSFVSNEEREAQTITFKKLNEEQRQAYSYLTNDESSLKLLNGAPGTGKSFLLRAVKEHYGNTPILGCALAASAANELEKSSDIKSQTLDSLLMELDTGKKELKQHSMIVVDEAGMVGIKKLNRLLNYARETHSKLIMVGDYNQLSPIECGFAFKNLLNNTKSASLRNIQRQRSQQDIDNIRLIEHGESQEVLKNLSERGLFTFDTDQTRCKFQLVEHWHSGTNQNYKESLILASTRHDVDELNLIARAKLHEENELSDIETSFSNHDGKTLTVAEGERVMFRANNRELEVQNGTTGTIKTITQHRHSKHRHVEVILDSGRELKFTTADYNALEYAYAMSIHKSQGKTVDRSFVWLNEVFLNKELNYVQMSRARNSTHTFGASALLDESEFQVSLANQANKANDKPDLTKAISPAP
ncbi:MobF family relaxase [Idiomarina abyssalis]|uniref:MobF family relaxase n=1 Tax=Idiomarina abyssalis TaxID=86102 RepID=UPI001C956351|nr:MobF family relaxase [Idiomarina abyssalis]QZN92018.1 relaxase domain-containing protein [Idiomarina abyssalis]